MSVAPNLAYPKTPAWIQEMTPGYWYPISGDRPSLGLCPTTIGSRYLIDTDPARDPLLNPAQTLKEHLRRRLRRDWSSPWHGKSGFPAITEAWNSAVFASRFGDSGSMIVFGGGHNSYFGSSVHAFDLASRRWRRLTDGYVSTAQHVYGEGAVYPNATYPDGSPLPPHTYDYVQYDEQGNDYILLKGQTELGPNVKAVAIPHLFNLDTLTWRHGPRHLQAVINSGGFTTWDAKRRYLWGHSGDAGGGNCFVAYCPDGKNADGTVGSWREFHPNKIPGDADHNAMQIHLDSDVIVLAVHSRNRLYAITPDEPANGLREIRSAGEMPNLKEYAALEYSERLRKLIYYAADKLAQVHAVSIEDEATWQQLTSARSLDPVQHALTETNYKASIGHTFGRFRVASFADCDVALLIRHTDSPVYAFRLPDLDP